jgi:hypothetical protein
VRALLAGASPAAGELIVIGADDYLINMSVERVDVGRARAAPDGGEHADLDEQAVVLAESLAESRGEPLADVHPKHLRRGIELFLIEHLGRQLGLVETDPIADALEGFEIDEEPDIPHSRPTVGDGRREQRRDDRHLDQAAGAYR